MENKMENKTGYRSTGYRSTGYRSTGYRSTGDRSTGYRSTGDYSTGYRSTGDQSTGNWSTGYWSTGYRSTGDQSTGNWSTGYWSTGDRSTGDYSTGNWSTGYRSTGNGSTGDWSTSDYSTGHFSTIDDTGFGAFNKPCSREEWENAKKPEFIYFNLTEWVPEEEMSDQDKEDFGSHKTTGGYLKALDYSDAWAKAWNGATEEDKELLCKLPNFDADVFKKISGIDVNAQAQ
jgi:hypothetical protein